MQSTFLDGHVVALYAGSSDTQDAYLAPNPGGYGAAGPDGALRLDLEGTNEVDGTYNADLLYFNATPDSINSGDTSTKSLVVKFPEEYFSNCHLEWIFKRRLRSGQLPTCRRIC